MRLPREQIDRFWASDWALSTLLIFLCTTIFVLRPLETLGLNVRLIASSFFSLILISGLVAVSHSRRMALVFGSVAVLSVMIRWTRYALYGPEYIAFEAIAAIVACGMLAAIVLTQVFREGPVTFQRIQGAVAAYLLIALMFAAAYSWVDVLVANAFSGPAPTAAEQHDVVQRFIYFSFVTLTTTGYGDITPQAPLARSLAMFEALIGQMFPSILLARLVSLELWYRQRRFEREQAVLDREELAREVARQLKGSER
jgi:Ion channel